MYHYNSYNYAIIQKKDVFIMALKQRVDIHLNSTCSHLISVIFRNNIMRIFKRVCTVNFKEIITHKILLISLRVFLFRKKK